MARFCMIGHPAPGHVNPTLPVIDELVRRGERGYYYATEIFRAKIEETGAVFRSLGDHSLFERNLSRGGILGGMSGLMQSAEELLPELLRQVQQDAPDYLLVEAHALWGNLLVQILSLPTVCLCSMFAMNNKLLTAAHLAEHLYHGEDSAREGLAELNRYFELARQLDRRYGTRSPGMIDYLGNPQALNIVFTARAFQIGEAAFDSTYKFVGPTSGIRMEGAVATADFDISLLRDPLILISMGTMYNREIELYKACCAAFADSPYQVAMAIGHRVDPSELGAIPSNFLVRPYLPQLQVLARAVLFLTHGGINSAHEAMLQGVPMLVLPSSADHFVVAGQVEAVGAGQVLHRSQAKAETIRTVAFRILQDEGYRYNAARIGKALQAAGGAGRAADEILNFVESREISLEADHVRI